MTTPTLATVLTDPTPASPAPFHNLESALLHVQQIAGGRGKQIVLRGQYTDDGWIIDICYTKTTLWGKIRNPWSTRTLRIYGSKPQGRRAEASYGLTWFPGDDVERALKTCVGTLEEIISSTQVAIAVLLDLGFKPALLETATQALPAATAVTAVTAGTATATAGTPAQFHDMWSAIPQVQWIAGGRGKQVILSGKTSAAGWVIDVSYMKTTFWGKVRIPWSTRTLRVYGSKPMGRVGATYGLSWIPGDGVERTLKTSADTLFEVISTTLVAIEVLMDLGFQPTLLETEVTKPNWVAPLN